MALVDSAGQARFHHRTQPLAAGHLLDQASSVTTLEHRGLEIP
jgi:hypothetical protein